MSEIELEKVYKDGKFMGTISIHENDLTPEFIKKIKEDTEDKMGHRKYWGVYDNKIRNKWRAVKIE